MFLWLSTTHWDHRKLHQVANFNEVPIGIRCNHCAFAESWHILKKAPNEFAKTNHITKSIQYTHSIHVFPAFDIHDSMIINAGKQ